MRIKFQEQRMAFIHNPCPRQRAKAARVNSTVHREERSGWRGWEKRRFHMYVSVAAGK